MDHGLSACLVRCWPWRTLEIRVRTQRGEVAGSRCRVLLRAFLRLGILATDIAIACSGRATTAPCRRATHRGGQHIHLRGSESVAAMRPARSLRHRPACRNSCCWVDHLRWPIVRLAAALRFHVDRSYARGCHRNQTSSGCRVSCIERSTLGDCRFVLACSTARALHFALAAIAVGRASAKRIKWPHGYPIS